MALDDIQQFGLDLLSPIARLADGTVSAPAFSFLNDPDSGIYRIGANNYGFAANGAKVAEIGTGGLTLNANTLAGARDMYLDAGGNHNIYGNAALTDATARTLSINVLDSTADAWLPMITLTPSGANPTTDFGYGIRHYFTASVSAASQSLNTAPTANTITAVNAQSFTATGHQMVLPAITPAANGGGITMTGLNFTQGAISNIADSEAITVKPIVITGAAGAALATGAYDWRGVNITIPNQAANGAVNLGYGIAITGGTQSASGLQRGIIVTMANSGHAAMTVVTGLIDMNSNSIESVSALKITSGGTIQPVSGNYTIQTANVNDAYTDIKARDNDNALVEVARAAGAADPYFSMGGSQQNIFYNSGKFVASVGVTVGADSTNNLIDDASNGAGTTPLYIGNAVVLVGNGVSFGPAAVASITVVNGQITAIS